MEVSRQAMIKIWVAMTSKNTDGIVVKQYLQILEKQSIGVWYC